MTEFVTCGSWLSRRFARMIAPVPDSFIIGIYLIIFYHSGHKALQNYIYKSTFYDYFGGYVKT
jgi:hypothetical protein